MLSVFMQNIPNTYERTRWGQTLVKLLKEGVQTEVQHILTNRVLKAAEPLQSQDSLTAEFERIKVRDGAWCLVPGAWCLVPGAWCLCLTGTTSLTTCIGISLCCHLLNSAEESLSHHKPSLTPTFSPSGKAIDMSSDEAQEVVGRWFTQEHWERISNAFVKDRSPADCQIYYRHVLAPQVRMPLLLV